MISLSDQPIDPGVLLSGFCRGRSETGAVASFVGLARADGQAASRLELEAYPGFTETAIAEIAHAAMERFSLDDLLIAHRVGVMAPGDPIVFVATAASHRRAAFEACDYLMDYLKSRAPFWKKAHGPDGGHWIEPRPQDYEDVARWERPASKETTAP
jgi:molybdopterin synthase catalytic subunit